MQIAPSFKSVTSIPSMTTSLLFTTHHWFTTHHNTRSTTHAAHRSMSAFRKQPNELSFTQLSQNQANSRASASHRSSAQPFISSKLLQPPESYTTEAKLAAVYNHLEQLRTTYNGSDTFLAIGLLRSDGAEAPVEHPEPAAPIGDNPSIAATTKYKVAYQAHITEADRRVLHKRNLCTVIKGSVSPALLVQIEAKHPGADDTLSTNPAALISCIRAMFVGRDLTREQASTNLADAQSRFMRSTYSGLVHSSIHLKFYKSTVGEADSILRSFGLGYNGILITQAMHNIISTLDLNEHVLENFYSNTMLLLGKHVTNNAEIAALEIKRSQKQQEIVQANGDHKKALIQEKQELTRSVTDKKESINKLPSTVEEFFESLETHIAMSRLRLRTSSRTQTALIASTEVSTLELNEPHGEHEDEVFFSNAEGPSQSSSQASQSPGQRVCVACGSSKHIVANCRHSQFCTHCDIPGHNYTSCRKRDEEPKKRKDTGLWCDRCDINTHNIDTCSRRKKLNVVKTEKSSHSSFKKK